MLRWSACVIVTAATASAVMAQPFNVRAWYAEGQVFVVWQFPAPPAVPTDTVEIYASPAAQASTLNMDLVGRMFFPEYTGGRLSLMLPAARILVPTPGGGTYRLAVDEGVFVYTPHAAGNLFFAVVDTGSTTVVAGNSAATAFLYDPVNDPVRPHWQFTAATAGGNPSEAWILWADGQSDYNAGRPDIPVLANPAKNGVPHIFAITLPTVPLPPIPPSCVFVMHGGDDLYTRFRPGQPERANMSLRLDDGIVVSPDDACFTNYQGTLMDLGTDWFGYVSNLDPFFGGVRTNPPSTSVVVNYTQRRIHWLIEWLLGPGSPYAIDPTRIAMIGHSRGARGTSHLTRGRPDLFCAAVCHCFPGDLTQPPQPGQVSPTRGHWSDNLATNLLAPDGSVLGIRDVVTPATRLSLERDVPLTRFYHGIRDEQGSATWNPAQRAILDLVHASGMGHMILWDEREHGVEMWHLDSNDATDDPAHCDPWPDMAQWIAPVRTERHSAQYLVDAYRSNISFPGFFNVDEDPLAPGRQPDPGPGDPCATGIDVWGTWGGYMDWDSPTIVDTPERSESTVFLRGLSTASVDNALVTEVTADFSPRRTQQFNPPEGTPVGWRLTNESDGTVVQSGTVVAGPEGLVTLTGLTIRRDPERRRIALSTIAATQWRSVRTHSGAGDLNIPLDATATGNGPAGPGVESRHGGLQRIEIDFSGPVSIVNSSGVSVTGYATSGGVLGGPVSYTPTSVAMADADTLVILLPTTPAGISLLPDESCYHIVIGPGVLDVSLAGDNDVYVRSLRGDTSASGSVNLSDALLTLSRVGQLAASNPQHDVNLSGGNINPIDVLLVKSRIASPAPAALCP